MKFPSSTIFIAGVVLASAGLSSRLSAAPMPAPLSDIDFSASGTAKEEYNSNVLSSANNNGGRVSKFDDYVATFNPGLTLKYGAIADTTLTFDYTETFYRYYVHPSLNEEMSNVDFNIQRKQGAFDLTAGVSFVQSYNNTPDNNVAGSGRTSILRTDTISANANAHWNYSDKFNFDAGLNYIQTRYLYTAGSALENSDTYTVPITGYYVYSDQVSVGAGYTYSQTSPKPPAAAPIPPATTRTPGASRYNNNFSLNTKLTKWNKLTGSANIGVSMNHVDAGVANGSPALDTTAVSYGVDLDYAYSDPLSITMNGSRNFSTGTAGQNIEATTLGLGVNYDYSSNVSATINLMTFTYSQYLQADRHDKTKTSGITVTWKPYSYLSFSTGYSYYMNSSDAANSTYNISTAFVSATVTY